MTRSCANSACDEFYLAGFCPKGDLKALAGQWQEYRGIFAIAPEEITIMRVRHRSEADR